MATAQVHAGYVDTFPDQEFLLGDSEDEVEDEDEAERPPPAPPPKQHQDRGQQQDQASVCVCVCVCVHPGGCGVAGAHVGERQANHGI